MAGQLVLNVVDVHLHHGDAFIVEFNHPTLVEALKDLPMNELRIAIVVNLDDVR